MPRRSGAIKRVVAASDGLGCLSRYAVAQSVADGHLVELRTRLPRASRKLAIVLHREKRLGRATTERPKEYASLRELGYFYS